MKKLLILIFVFPFLTGKAQIDFSKIKRQKLHPVVIDTVSENIFVFEKKDMNVVFRQADILNYIDSICAISDCGNYYNDLCDTLETIREIRLMDFLYSYVEVEKDSILKNENISLYHKRINEQFFYVGAHLILLNKFMLVDRSSGMIIRRKLIAKQTEGILGTTYLECFYAPNKSFYTVVTRLGE